MGVFRAAGRYIWESFKVGTAVGGVWGAGTALYNVNAGVPSTNRYVAIAEAGANANTYATNFARNTTADIFWNQMLGKSPNSSGARAINFVVEAPLVLPWGFSVLGSSLGAVAAVAAKDLLAGPNNMFSEAQPTRSIYGNGVKVAANQLQVQHVKANLG